MITPNNSSLLSTSSQKETPSPDALPTPVRTKKIRKAKVSLPPTSSGELEGMEALGAKSTKALGREKANSKPSNPILSSTSPFSFGNGPSATITPKATAGDKATSKNSDGLSESTFGMAARRLLDGEDTNPTNNGPFGAFGAFGGNPSATGTTQPFGGASTSTNTSSGSSSSTPSTALDRLFGGNPSGVGAPSRWGAESASSKTAGGSFGGVRASTSNPFDKESESVQSSGGISGLPAAPAVGGGFGGGFGTLGLFGRPLSSDKSISSPK